MNSAPGLTAAVAISPSGRDALVFSGGGILFATHVGVMAEMEGWTSGDRPFLDHFQVVVGTSAGALYGALYASGLSPAQIALYSRIFTDPQVGPGLFDRNYAGAGAAFIRHDSAYALGAVRGLAIHTLLETVFSRPVHQELLGLQPSKASDADRQRVFDLLVNGWEKRRTRQRDASYYQDQLTFADCKKELFVIAVNAYNGQKTVFANRPYQGEWKREQADDNKLYEQSAPPYLNAPGGPPALPPNETQGEDQSLQFRRWENRLYRGYDSELYGPQLPLALAVRGSISIPVIFEPLRLRRWHEKGEPSKDEDLFIDGGVDDNFSISVAVDPLLGNAKHVLGISLGNLGYRLPDARAAESVVALLSKTTTYMGDAILDLIGSSQDLLGHRVLVVNAMPGLSSKLTDTNLIEALIVDGRTIAQDLWQVLHGTASQSGTGLAFDWTKGFAKEPQCVYLSPAARGFKPPKKPRALDRDLRFGEVFKIPLDLPTEWKVLYIIIALASLGAGTALYIVLQAAIDGFTGHPLRAIGGLLSALVVGLVSIVAGILLTRTWAFGYWRNRPSRQR